MGRPCITAAVKRRRIHLLRPNIDVGRAGLPNVSWEDVKKFLQDHPPPAMAASAPENELPAVNEPAEQPS